MPEAVKGGIFLLSLVLVAPAVLVPIAAEEQVLGAIDIAAKRPTAKPTAKSAAKPAVRSVPKPAAKANVKPATGNAAKPAAEIGRAHV